MKTHVRRGGRSSLYLFVAIIIVVIYVAWAILRPLPDIQPVDSLIQSSASSGPAKLVWPANVQSASGLVGDKSTQTSGKPVPLPIASTAKIITCLVVLNEKPLKLGEQGPMITLGPNDVALYNSYAAQDGSVVKVVDGEQISQYQMLQTIMLPSANNMADSLAIWAFGSLENYRTQASLYLKNLDITDTQVGTDASGMSPTSTSTAKDLVKIGRLAMDDPVLAQIAGQSTASGIPVVDNIKNVNFLLGSRGIVGLKTGNTDQAGGVFVSASNTKVGQRPVTIVTAVLGAPSLFASMSQSVPLLESAQKDFKNVVVAKAGSTVGQYKLPWGGEVTAVASTDLSVTAAGGQNIKTVAKLDKIPADSTQGKLAGNMRSLETASSAPKAVPLVLQSSVPKPNIGWRLTHPF